jgi:hypothetical protein
LLFAVADDVADPLLTATSATDAFLLIAGWIFRPRPNAASRKRKIDFPPPTFLYKSHDV